MSTEPPRLLDRVRTALRARHYSDRTEEAYIGWIKRFIFFHHKRHPMEMGTDQVNEFLSDLAQARRVSASTQNQAFSAILFLYGTVLERPLGELSGVVRATRPSRLPEVLNRSEVEAILAGMNGVALLVATLLYGTGMRLLECLRLRVKDLDFERGEIMIRDGKGRMDRRTMLPESLKRPLARHLERVRQLHQADLEEGYGSVYLPEALRGSIHPRQGNGAGNSYSRQRGAGPTRNQA